MNLTLNKKDKKKNEMCCDITLSVPVRMSLNGKRKEQMKTSSKIPCLVLCPSLKILFRRNTGIPPFVLPQLTQ